MIVLALSSLLYFETRVSAKEENQVLSPVRIWVEEQGNPYHRVGIIATTHELTLINQFARSMSFYRLNLRTGAIRIINRRWGSQTILEMITANDGGKYADRIAEMLDVNDLALSYANSLQKEQVQPIRDYIKSIESRFCIDIPVTAFWRARVDDVWWNDSRGITGVTSDAVNNQLVLYSMLDTAVNNYRKGEAYIYSSDIKAIGATEFDMAGSKLILDVFIPSGFVADAKSPDSLRLFMKSSDNWAPVYGIWRKVAYSDEGAWQTMEFDPMAQPASWKNKDFDITRIREMGLVFTKGSGSYYGGELRLKDIRIRITQPVTIEEPVVTLTPPVDTEDFINASGRNLSFDEVNYGWCVGKFPVIWGSGEDGGFSNPAVRERFRERLLYLKSKGISTVRLMALFADLRTGIAQDAEGNFIYNARRQLQFDDKVYPDVKAFLDILYETGMKGVVCLFDFRVADRIQREGPRSASYLVGEHAEIFNDPDAQDAFVCLFRDFFKTIYTPGFLDYDINNVVRFWEIMNEPESVCAAKFNKVKDFHDRFFALIRAQSPAAIVTTSSLTLDAAFRFWKQDMDVISVHHYPDIESLNFSEPVGGYGFGNKPVYWTEFGDRNLSIALALDGIYSSGASSLLFWKDDWYTFNEDEYQAWVNARLP